MVKAGSNAYRMGKKKIHFDDLNLAAAELWEISEEKTGLNWSP